MRKPTEAENNKLAELVAKAHEQTRGRKPWETPYDCNINGNNGQIWKETQLRAARALYEAMERDKAMMHLKSEDIPDCSPYLDECTRKCPACKYERLLWPEGRG